MSAYTIYSRKSLEDDDSQVQSIPSQEREMKSLAARLNLNVVESLSEAKSAKAPGRPVFEEMMRKVDRGEIRGILCWKLDRLARNPVDGGRIIWAMKQHGLVIRTPHQTFSHAEDNLILMYIEFGMAQKYVDDLSRNTIRGLRAKALRGWFPGVAPIGYLNSKVEERGQKTILPDPERFDAVRRMWDLMLTSSYGPDQIRKVANSEWGFRTRQAKRTGGKPLARSTIYKMFSDPFYCGRFEYPKGSSQWYRGEHKPMVTEAEFARVQQLLHRNTNPRPKKEFDLPYRGLLKCGECGSNITAHFKEQVRCTRCGYKSSVKNRDSCSKCRLPIDEMRGAERRCYAYYHCTRTLNPLCRQKGVAAKELDQQVAEKILAFGLSPELREWGMRFIEKLRGDAMKDKEQIIAEKKKALEQCVTRLENLVKLKTAPENAEGSLLSDGEYQKQRTELLAIKNRLATDASSFEAELKTKARVVTATLMAACAISQTASDCRAARRKEVLSALGLNHVITEKELEIRPQFPFSELPLDGNRVPRNPEPTEPDSNEERQRQNGDSASTNPRLERDMDEDRTKDLKTALETIWEKINPFDPAFCRYPFTETMPAYTPSRKRGRFISPKRPSP